MKGILLRLVSGVIQLVRAIVRIISMIRFSKVLSLIVFIIIIVIV